ncbi:MAG: hypothetical protein PVJ43_08820 [Gemmatimonadales bacterium]|jgi:predicted Co/Zn/Cd cation transporter (cation efflux family)
MWTLRIGRWTPPTASQKEVRERFDESIRWVGVEKSWVRMVKIGRFLYVVRQVEVPSSFHLQRVSELDETRTRIAKALADIHPRQVLDRVFTEDEPWTKWRTGGYLSIR